MINDQKLKPWKIIESKTIHQNKWIKIKADTCEVDGKKLTYTYTHRIDEGPMIIPEESPGKLWLVKQYRHPIKKIIWQFPAEGRLPNENWEDAAQRGIMEEIGRKADSLVELTTSHPDPGGLEQTTKIFVASDLQPLDKNTNIHLDEFEHLRTQAFTLKEIDALISKGEICDNWTFTGLYWYQKYAADA